jgi:thiosulfate reductase cytochrome b subunit
MADSIWSLRDAVTTTADAPRHSTLVRITHWLTTLSVLALLLSGIEIIVSHPRFYWGETGNPMTPSLFDLPIPASRPWVNTGYGFVLPDQNGWSRNLHFEAAWVVIFTGLVYVISGLLGRHFRKNLLPAGDGFTWRALSKDIANHLRFHRPDAAEAWSYNILQRLTYLSVIFVLFPLAIWTGLAMSPAIVSVFPTLVTVFGGHQSARTIHFFVSVFLVLFLLIHIVMVCRAGFRNRMRAMIAGNS